MTKSNWCILCKYYRNDLTCAAYPEKIPDLIFWDGHNHFISNGEDKGIVFEPKNERAKDAAISLGYVPVEVESD